MLNTEKGNYIFTNKIKYILIKKNIFKENRIDMLEWIKLNNKH